MTTKDSIKLRQLAIELEHTALRYALQNQEVQKRLNSLKDIIERAKTLERIDSEERIPGQHWFSEGELSKYPDLENAYACFSIFIAAGSLENYERLLSTVKKATTHRTTHL